MKKPTSVYIDTRLVLAMNARGIEISPWINRAMALFLDVPEDPNDHLIKKKTETVVSTLLLSYQTELQNKVKEFSKDSELREKMQEKESNSIELGKWIKKRPEYSLFQRYFDIHEYDDDILSKVYSEYERKYPGKFSDKDVFWNALMNWYNKFELVKD